MSLKDTLLIGCIADDFTGASDAASFLAKGGLVTVLCDGIPQNLEHCEGCQAIVIALKTRSVEKELAVDESLHALHFLQEAGAKSFYFKYCSTFDSTPKGNIGPVADSIMERLGTDYSLLCPALPVNKRVVRDGQLIVDGIPLDQGHMKNHPLNPMWDSYIDKLMEPQSKYPCFCVTHDELFGDPTALKQKLDKLKKEFGHFYLIPDYTADEDGEKIADIFGEHEFVTGGSGLLEHLAKLKSSQSIKESSKFDCAVSGRGIALCGSCSKATGEQIASFKRSGRLTVAVDPAKILNGEQSVKRIWDCVESNKTKELLIYSIGAEVPIKKSGDPIRDAQASKAIEETMAALGKLAYDNNFTRIIVGGGETSGAVMLALGLDSFYIGESIAPGVPIMIPTSSPNMRIALKSGNFGQADFFEQALDRTKAC